MLRVALAKMSGSNENKDRPRWLARPASQSAPAAALAASSWAFAGWST